MLYDQIRELGDEVERLRRENERLRVEAGRAKREEEETLEALGGPSDRNSRG
jgi:hypothetical protein